MLMRPRRTDHLRHPRHAHRVVGHAFVALVALGALGGVASAAPAGVIETIPPDTAPPPPPPAESTPFVYPSTPAPSLLDRPQNAARHGEPPIDERLLHGFRLGYGYVMDFDKPVKSLGGQSLADRTNMRAPHNFLIGYEAFYRMVGHSWLNVILTGNVIIAGLEQSQFYPTGNALLGFELKSSFQIGVGANFAPLKGNIAHTIFAAGWTPRVGSFYTPVHAFFIPDVDGVHRMGLLTGVTW